MDPLTHIFVLGLSVILTECTFHRGGLHHGMMGMPMYGSPYMYPGMGMGMGMYQGGPMMYGMRPGFMPFKEAVDTEAGSTENPENISSKKIESGNTELTKFQEPNDSGNSRMVRGTFEELNSFKDTQVKNSKLTTETVRKLVKREVIKSEDKNLMDLASDLPIVFPNDVDETSEKLEEVRENAVTESSFRSEPNEVNDKSISEKDILELARNSDYVMIPIVQADSPALFDSYANQRDTQTPLAAKSQNLNQENAPNLNNYPRNIQNQIPIYGIQLNNMNGVAQNYNVLPVNNIGNTPGVITFLTLPNNIGDQTGNVPNNQYYVNTVPQNIVNRAGLQNSPSYNVAPMNQPQNNLIGFLVQSNTIPHNNQHSNNIPINNQLVNVMPISKNLTNVPVGNNAPANSYILVNSPQNVGPLPNQAGLNAWNVPVVKQPQNFNQQSLDQQPNNNPNQDSSVSNGYMTVTEQVQPLNVNTNYIPVYYNTRDEVDRNEINS